MKNAREAEPARNENPIGYFNMRKVVTESVAIFPGTDSFGVTLDLMLRDAALANEDVQTIELEISQKTWDAFKIAIRP